MTIQDPEPYGMIAPADDEEQDLEPGVPVPPEAPVASQTISFPQVATRTATAVPPPPTSGAIPRASRPPVVQDPGGFNMELWREKNANMPIAQAEESVAAALRFQAVRQYQQDIAAGKSPAEALARSAPLMFYGPKNTLGTAAAFMRASGNQRPIDIGGVGYKQGPDGSLIPVTPPKADAYDVAEYRSVLGQIAATQKELDDLPIGDAAAGEKRAKLQFLREQLKAIRKRSTPPQPLPVAPRPPAPTVPGTRTTPPIVAAAAPADSVNEVKRHTKDGRVAIFDANTRKFLRYATE